MIVNMLLLVFFSVLLSLWKVTSVRDENISCREWAEIDKECSKNPRFMWGSCQPSCLQVAQDEHEECKQWADQGECSNNANYVAIHCPVACEYAVAWNTWLRVQLNIDQMHIGGVGDFVESCHVPMDILGAAELLRMRLHHFVIEANPFTIGITSDGPGGEFNGLVGLSEGILYMLRMYIKVISRMMMQSTTSIPEADNRAQVKRLMDDTHNRLNEVIHVMTPPIVWQKDLLMIMVPRWLNMMQDLSRRVSLYMPYGAYDLGRDSSQQSRSECLVISDYDDFSLLVPADIKSAPNMAVKHMKYQRTKGFGKKFTTLTLSNGNEMPVMGLGTWMLNGDECVHMVMEAFRLGYRHIDGAEAYGNDREIGVAIQHAIADGIVDRKDIFIANKISNEANAGYENTKQLILTQLKIMGLKYFDLYMIHSPMQDYHLMEDTWKAMQELYQQGIVKAIGLSNFGSNDLRRVLSFPSLVIKPMVIQNKLDIYHVGKQIDVDGDGIISLMKEHDIRMVAYSSLSSFPFSLQPHEDPIIRHIANTKHNSDDDQGNDHKEAIVVLRWILQQGIAVIPRTAKLDKLASNMQAVSPWCALGEEEMKIITSISHLTGSPISVPVVY